MKEDMGTVRLKFSDEERGKLMSTFMGAFDKLSQSMPVKDGEHCESNNHFDDDFHKQLLDGLHLKTVA